MVRHETIGRSVGFGTRRCIQIDCLSALANAGIVTSGGNIDLERLCSLVAA
jgi:hypothetical protein